MRLPNLRVLSIALITCALTSTTAKAVVVWDETTSGVPHGVVNSFDYNFWCSKLSTNPEPSASWLIAAATITIAFCRFNSGRSASPNLPLSGGESVKELVMKTEAKGRKKPSSRAAPKLGFVATPH